MILLFSTSSAWASVALFSPEGELVFSEEAHSPMRASEACLRMISDLDLRRVRVFGADAGPGSFTGVKVGVTLAKTLAWAQDASCCSVSAFDLIDRTSPVSIPIRRGVVLRRDPGTAPALVGDEEALAAAGYGLGRADEAFPLASRAEGWIAQVPTLSPIDFVPDYLVEPSISKPKKPLILEGPGG